MFTRLENRDCGRVDRLCRAGTLHSQLGSEYGEMEIAAARSLTSAEADKIKDHLELVDRTSPISSASWTVRSRTRRLKSISDSCGFKLPDY